MLYRYIISLTLSLLVLLSPSAFALDVPPLTGRIVDLAHLLPSDVAASLSAELAEHDRKTGNQIVILTLPSLEGEPLEEFSHRVSTTWKLGRTGTDNGVLLLVVPGERRIRIEVGYGLEGTLTDAKSSQIIRREIVPRFKSGDFAAGINAGVKAIMATIEGTYTAPNEPSQQSAFWEVFFIAIGIGAFVGGSLFGGTLKGMGSILSGLLSFVIALPTGWKLALVAAVLGIVAALIISALSGGIGPSGRRRRGGWDYPGWGGGLGGGGGWSSSDSFSGGGGDFGGGGASGRW
ncbi:MAG: TPM domain-containing protein [Nitrospirota bacterium]|nr:TPM domain-containing protein [Nitrospirota bacterium]